VGGWYRGVTALTEKAFNGARQRELRRFHQSVNQVIDTMLVEKYEATRQAEEYRRFARTCGFIRNVLQIVDILADNAAPLFDKTDERSNWETYLSGARRTLRQMPDSYLFRFVLPMFGLEDIREKVSSFSGKWLEQIHASHKVLRTVDGYIANADKGAAIAAEYSSSDAEVVRLYASLKTWQTKGELDGFVREVEEFLSSTVEVFISGPLQLYLMINRDTMLLIFKSLSVGRLSELRDGASEYAEIMKLSDFVHDAVEHSGTIEAGREIVTRAVKEYATSLRAEQERLRAQLPTRSMRHNFIQRFESGALFTREE
jgi:hypothetical protein